MLRIIKILLILAVASWGFIAALQNLIDWQGTLGAIGAATSMAAGTAEFQRSKDLALSGCAISILMLFGGFVVIAETWFELWRSDVLRGPVLDSAFHYGGMIALIALFVGSPDEL